MNSSLSAMIEESLFQAHQQSTGKSYLAQYRDIMANLKDTKNDLKSVEEQEDNCEALNCGLSQPYGL